MNQSKQAEHEYVSCGNGYPCCSCGWMCVGVTSWYKVKNDCRVDWQAHAAQLPAQVAQPERTPETRPTLREARIRMAELDLVTSLWVPQVEKATTLREITDAAIAIFRKRATELNEIIESAPAAPEHSIDRTLEQEKQQELADRKRVEEWLCAGGGGHEDGMDGLRAGTWSGIGLVEMLVEYGRKVRDEEAASLAKAREEALELVRRWEEDASFHRARVGSDSDDNEYGYHEHMAEKIDFHIVGLRELIERALRLTAPGRSRE